jgi:hypothetical protein
MHGVVENVHKLSVRSPERTDLYGGVFPYGAVNVGTTTVTMKYKFRSVNGIFILCHNTCFHHTGIN